MTKVSEKEMYLTDQFKTINGYNVSFLTIFKHKKYLFKYMLK